MNNTQKYHKYKSVCKCIIVHGDKIKVVNEMQLASYSLRRTHTNTQVNKSAHLQSVSYTTRATQRAVLTVYTLLEPPDKWKTRKCLPKIHGRSATLPGAHYCALRAVVASFPGKPPHYTQQYTNTNASVQTLVCTHLPCTVKMQKWKLNAKYWPSGNTALLLLKSSVKHVALRQSYTP